MSKLINTGVEAVDRLGEMRISGNVIPANWFKMILNENGKANLLAICILSEIVYWYRPTEIRDELTGEILSYKKKFRDDLLQKSYAELATQFGESKHLVKKAMDCLEKLGVIRRVFRNITFDNGGTATNVMYVMLFADRLEQLTYGTSNAVPPTSGQIVQRLECQEVEKIETKQPEIPVNMHVSKNGGIIPTENDTYPPKVYRDISAENDTYPSKEWGDIPQKMEGYIPIVCEDIMQKSGGYPLKKWGTNTEITAENTTKTTSEITAVTQDPPSILSISKEQEDMTDGIDFVRSQVKRRVLYDVICKEDAGDIWILDSLVELMTEVLYQKHDLKLGGQMIPFELVKERFESYNHRTMTYVLESLRANKRTPVKNKRQYLLTTLFNAPATKMAAISMDVRLVLPD